MAACALAANSDKNSKTPRRNKRPMV